MAQQQTTISVNGMSCTHCERTVGEAIRELDGIIDVKVDHTTGKAEVTFDDAKVSVEKIKAAVNDTGIYTAA